MALQQETKIKEKATTSINLPSGFLLGAASAAHQVEGDNINSDWWQAELKGDVPKSGMAADHYHKFDEDFALAEQIGLNAVRISIEWARIEPEEGRWDSTAIEHYKKVLKSMKDHNQTRMVTLWHWTMPRWFAEKGGFEKSEGAEAFARYAWFVAQNLGKDIDLWITLNEPEIYAGLSHQQGKHPPFKQNLFETWMVIRNLISAHKAAYRAIKKALPKAKIGIAKNSAYYEPYRKNNFFDIVLAYFADRISNHYFLEKIQKQMDFVGMNYYFYNKIKFTGFGYEEMNHNFNKGQMQLTDAKNRSDMGWLIYPQGLYQLLINLKKYKKPIYITETGLADAVDTRRPKFIRDSLNSVVKAMKDKVDVKGYFYWALTDNYEWTQGYGPRFGLIEIDYATQKRTIRKSAEIFKEVKYV